MISKALHRIFLGRRLKRVKAIKPSSCCRMCMSNKTIQPAVGSVICNRSIVIIHPQCSYHLDNT